MPRFAPETYAQNLALLPAYEALAAEAGCTPAQLALAWLLSRGGHVIPIPGTTQLAHLQENMGTLALDLPAEVLARADALINRQTVAGDRYAPATLAEVDTETF
jgi:aryl-alcohol dehydrogenase-like predicted oxidoreductase